MKTLEEQNLEIKEIEEKYLGKLVKYAGSNYECCGVASLFGCIFLEIYDEPPSKHVDRIKLSSIEFDSAP